MIERVLAAEFGGRAAIDYRPHGLVFTVEAPAAGLIPGIDPNGGRRLSREADAVDRRVTTPPIGPSAAMPFRTAPC